MGGVYEGDGEVGDRVIGWTRKPRCSHHHLYRHEQRVNGPDQFRKDGAMTSVEPTRAVAPSTAIVPDPSPAPRPERSATRGAMRVEPLDPDTHAAALYAASHGDPEGEDLGLSAVRSLRLGRGVPCSPECSGRRRRSALLHHPATRERSGRRCRLADEHRAGSPLDRDWSHLARTRISVPRRRRALFLLIAHALDDLGYRRMEWKCNAANAASRAAACRLGFIHEGSSISIASSRA